jgi:hypothetical protein
MSFLLRRKDKRFGYVLVFLVFCHAEERSISRVIPVMSLAPMNLRVFVPQKDKESEFRFALCTIDEQGVTQFTTPLNF